MGGTQADLNCAALNGRTPLHLAASCNKPAEIRLLAELGARLNVLDHKVIIRVRVSARVRVG